jgi:uncharacterized membrane protein
MVRFVNCVQPAFVDNFSARLRRTRRRTFMETRMRSLVKAAIWTLLGLVVMSLIGLLFTGSLLTDGIMAVVNSVIGLATYPIYERVWAGVSWGRYVGAGGH